IDQDNKNHGSESLSDESGQSVAKNAEQQAARFSYLIELLHWYRPERPVDGLLLTVSAKTLLQIADPASLSALGEKLFQQLWQSQKHSGFVLPVYLIVTQCDHVEGFDAFWQAQGQQKRQQMIGWSNPYRLDCAFSKDWVKEAFDQVTKNFQDAQLAVAAGGQEIADIDRFMLFLHHFSALFVPLSEVVTGTFARSSFQEALPLRGIYFTGQVQGQQAFVNDLMIHKVFAEKHLAFVTEQRRFSSQKTMRRFQFASLAGAVVLVALIVIDSFRLANHSRYSAENLQRLLQAKPDCTREGLDTYRVLGSLSDISDRPLLLSLPMSWFNGQANQQKQLIADQLFKPVLFASLECRLKIRAASLRLLTLENQPNQNYRMVINEIKAFSQMLQDFQLNRERFLILSGPLNDTRGIGKALAGLLTYLYDRPIPQGVDPAASLTTGAIMLLNYNVDWDELENSLIGRGWMMDHLDELTKALHQALVEHAQRSPLVELRQRSENTDQVAPNVELPPSPLLDNVELFRAWLLTTEKDWLSATAATSPCGNIYQLLSDLREPLV
ncbi:MAG: type VI secretion system protein, partial [Psychrosphaera sp.]|nr:type VI secretion system protein [Psychrosphaera sp.]